jgi:hypothetical protein
MSFLSKSLLETLAMTIIGDSVLCMVSPRRHLSLWTRGPRLFRRMSEPLVRHPDVTRMLGAFGLGFGLWLAWRQEPPADIEEPARFPRRLMRQLEEVVR